MRFRNENVEVPLLKQDPSLINEYFHIIARENSTVSFSTLRDLQYSKDKINWTDHVSTSASISANAGEKIYWRRKISTPASGQLGTFRGTGSWDIAGNLCSLLDGTNYKTMTSLIGWGSSGNGIFENIIGNSFPAVDARQLYVTATSQSDAYSYRNFFLENQTLIYGPTICVNIDFYWAFARCPNLEYGPTILAPNLGLTGSWILCPKLKYIKCMTINQISFPWD